MPFCDLQEINLVWERTGKQDHMTYLCKVAETFLGLFYLLCVVGCVGQHSGHMKHNFVVLVARVEGMCPC